jgi:hypothetical protein
LSYPNPVRGPVAGTQKMSGVDKTPGYQIPQGPQAATELVLPASILKTETPQFFAIRGQNAGAPS